MRRFVPFSLLLFTFPIHQAFAVDSTLNGAGFTGLGITPNAHAIEWGRAEVAYENQVAGNPANVRGHDFVAGFGLLPNLELVGRLASNDLNTNCFTARCGVRDLSASGKFSISLDSSKRARIAVGATDVGGSVTYFRTYYGVVSYGVGAYEASAGYAHASGAGIGGSRSPLDGPFLSLAWQPIQVLRGHVEYSDGRAWVGARFFAPSQWLPQGWSASASAQIAVNDTALTRRSWYGVNLSIPLYKVPALPGGGGAPSLPERRPSATVAAPSQPTAKAEERVQGSVTAQRTPDALRVEPNVVPPASSRGVREVRPSSDDQLRSLADALGSKGLEDISIGRMPDGTIAVRANNASYQWNALDALGAALGAVARGLSENRSGYRLILTQRQVPLVGVTGQADCLREWIELASNSCTAGQLSTPGVVPLDALHDGAVWVVRDFKPAWQTVRVTAGPVLRTLVGTELGAIDYTLGLSLGAQLPLWGGASAEGSVSVPVAESDDFRSGRAFAVDRVQRKLERLTGTQTWRVPVDAFWPSANPRLLGTGALVAQAVVGRIGTYYDGALGSLRWEPGEGVHRLSAEGGLFRNNSYDSGRGPLGTLQRAAPLLGSYRYSFMPTRTDLEATAGRFMNNDRGYQLALRQWFADTNVQAYFRSTAYPGSGNVKAVGVGISLPIGPRRNWEPSPHLLVGGVPRFAHAIETTIRNAGGNAVTRGRGVRPAAAGIDAASNSDRTGLAYFEDNLRRVREAAR